jgi:fatty acid desaturase
MTAIHGISSGAERPVEWQTWVLIIGLWTAFGLLTWHAAWLPWWIVTPLGAFLVCLHGSAQHEAVHGHPTHSRLINELVLFPPISLWFPYRRYQRLHLIHHNDEDLTDPARDPESYYLDPQAWAGAPAALKFVFTLNNSMLGRFVLGPLIATLRFAGSEMKRILAGDREALMGWALHGIGAAIVFAWAAGVCGIDPLYYVFGIAYWGNALTLMRSYAEHRAHDAPGCRIIVVESNPLVSFMYLNNNLHMAHHETPRLPWYRLPAFYRANRERLLRENCAYLMHGYGEIARRWLFVPKEPVAHPDMAIFARRKPAETV